MSVLDKPAESPRPEDDAPKDDAAQDPAQQPAAPVEQPEKPADTNDLATEEAKAMEGMVSSKAFVGADEAEQAHAETRLPDPNPSPSGPTRFERNEHYDQATQAAKSYTNEPKLTPDAAPKNGQTVAQPTSKVAAEFSKFLAETRSQKPAEQIPTNGELMAQQEEREKERAKQEQDERDLAAALNNESKVQEPLAQTKANGPMPAPEQPTLPRPSLIAPQVEAPPQQVSPQHTAPEPTQPAVAPQEPASVPLSMPEEQTQPPTEPTIPRREVKLTHNTEGREPSLIGNVAKLKEWLQPLGLTVGELQAGQYGLPHPPGQFWAMLPIYKVDDLKTPINAVTFTESLQAAVTQGTLKDDQYRQIVELHTTLVEQVKQIANKSMNQVSERVYSAQVVEPSAPLPTTPAFQPIPDTVPAPAKFVAPEPQSPPAVPAAESAPATPQTPEQQDPSKIKKAEIQKLTTALQVDVPGLAIGELVVTETAVQLPFAYNGQELNDDDPKQKNGKKAKEKFQSIVATLQDDQADPGKKARISSTYDTLIKTIQDYVGLLHAERQAIPTQQQPATAEAPKQSGGLFNTIKRFFGFGKKK